MANVFTNAKSAAVGVTDVDIYTVPVGTTAVVHGLFISNILSTTVKVTVKLNTFNVLKNIDVPPNSTLVINKPINLLAGEILKVVSDTAVSVDVVVAILEVS